MIKAVVFDFFGVFVPDSDKAVIDDVGSQNVQEGKLLADTMTQNDMNELPLLKVAEVFTSISRRPQAEIDFIFFGKKEIDPNVVRTIQELRDKGYKTGMLSNAGPEILQQYFDDQGLAELFDEMVISYKVRLLKPDVKIYELMAEKLGVSCPEVLFVDDREGNIKGARDAGMRTILYTNFAQFDKELTEVIE